jgi:prevent-host-death family protein
VAQESEMRVISIGDSAATVRGRRLDLDLSEDQLARRAGVSRSMPIQVRAHADDRRRQTVTNYLRGLLPATPRVDVVTESCYGDYMEIGVRELKAKLSEVLARVERGEVVGVSSRGRRIAQIVPAPGVANIERGLAEGWITRAVDGPPTAVTRRRPKPGTPATSELIRADRDA